MQQPPYSPQDGPPPGPPQAPQGQPAYGQAPYGQAPYGQPPYNQQSGAQRPDAAPRRSIGFPVYCLGCLGLVALAFIALAGIGMYQARKMMSPPITAATLPSVMPAGVPLYPRFTLVENESRQIQKTIPSRSGAGGYQITALTFTCPDPVFVVGPWYQRALVSKGWRGRPSPQNPGAYVLDSSHTMIVLSDSKRKMNGQPLVTMVITRGVPGTTSPRQPGP